MSNIPALEEIRSLIDKLVEDEINLLSALSEQDKDKLRVESKDYLSRFVELEYSRMTNAISDRIVAYSKGDDERALLESGALLFERHRREWAEFKNRIRSEAEFKVKTFVRNQAISQETNQDYRRDWELLNNEHAIVVSKNKELRAKLSAQARYKRKPQKEELWTLADECRKKNGSINYVALGKKLGVSYHTAQRWCQIDRVT